LKKTVENIASEPAPEDWGGKWTELKLTAFIEYLKAYLMILNKQKWEKIYFDGFAGTGERIIKKKKLPDLFDYEIEQLNTEEITLYQGSVSRVLHLEAPYLFNYYYFIESNEESVASLEELKKRITHIPKERIVIRKEDCNTQLTILAKAMKSKKYVSLVLLDPFGMHIDWENIAQLKDTRTDIWVLIPSGVAINRLLDRAGRIKAMKKLESFFGLSEADITAIFYPTTQSDTLFGEATTTKKVDNPIDKIIEVYSKQLKSVWKHVSKPLVLKNSKNNPIFISFLHQIAMPD
jgi:three-Cys-motif partner protein